jgi:hypothetical protein
MSDLSDAEVQRPRLWPLEDPLRPENFSVHSTNQGSQSTSQSDSDDGAIRGPGDIDKALEADEAEKMHLLALSRYWKGRVLSLFFFRTQASRINLLMGLSSSSSRRVETSTSAK